MDRDVLRCRVCGCPHIALSAVQLRLEGAALDKYLRCSQCGTVEGFVPGELTVDELMLPLRSCVDPLELLAQELDVEVGMLRTFEEIRDVAGAHPDTTATLTAAGIVAALQSQDPATHLYVRVGGRLHSLSLEQSVHEPVQQRDGRWTPAIVFELLPGVSSPTHD